MCIHKHICTDVSCVAQFWSAMCTYIYHVMLLSPGLYQTCDGFFNTGQNQQSSIVWTTSPVIQ